MLAVGSLAAGPASAAASVGSAFAPTNPCTSGITFVQTTSPPGTSYAVATAGVISSWQFQAAPASVPQIKFKVFRPNGGSSFTVIGSSEVVAPAANQLSSYPIRVPVLAGDVIGLATLSAGHCAATGSLHFIVGDAAVGTTQAYTAGAGTIDVAAVVEPDIDGDGYGDETQDGCPSQANAQGTCDKTAPSSTVTSGRTSTTKTHVKFRFTSDDPSATYECRLKGKHVRKAQLKSFRPCTSPQKYKHLKVGTYKFLVRATDLVGNIEQSPAEKRFKVLQKR